MKPIFRLSKIVVNLIDSLNYIKRNCNKKIDIEAKI